MIAVEIEAPIINHRVEFSSDQLPTNIARAKILVMYDEESNAPSPRETDIVALARAARASFSGHESRQLDEEFATMRSEWNGRGFER